ncbi:hypothetical protein [Reyranella sp. CPCC 100927]|uniref:hypothetical protein n=1 Tax=Reyranella sp. CPCC 100927 TaxID=2599616 RepID=UPI0011B69364|nr:hypothetical protein [Reyranella sp. CPCC 100927]TWT02009.1 hypothetical protein FQU96_30995 [Reyranella sp. CPCC 100927]
MFVIKEAADRGEGLLGPRFDSAAEAHYYLLKHMRRRYRHRGYDESQRVYWGRQGAQETETLFRVVRHSRGDAGH